MVGYEHASGNHAPIAGAVLVRERIRIEHRVCGRGSRVAADRVGEVVHQRPMPFADRTSRGIDDAAAVTERVVRDGRIVLWLFVKEDRLVPLAHDRAVNRAAARTLLELEPFARRRRRANWPGRRLDGKGDRCRVELWLGRSPFQKAGEPAQLKVILEEPVADLRMQCLDIALQERVLLSLPAPQILQPPGLFLQGELDVPGVGVRVPNDSLRFSAYSGWNVEQFAQPRYQPVKSRHHRRARSYRAGLITPFVTGVSISEHVDRQYSGVSLGATDPRCNQTPGRTAT